jgi:Guanylate-binding protein, N-terminal domain
MSVIDERALENLSFMTNMTKYIAPDVTNYLPNFVWVVRDFSLEFSDSEQKHEKVHNDSKTLARHRLHGERPQAE